MYSSLSFGSGFLFISPRSNGSNLKHESRALKRNFGLHRLQVTSIKGRVGKVNWLTSYDNYRIVTSLSISLNFHSVMESDPIV